MDEFDERLLQILEFEGRISNVELAKRIGLSPSATLRRVQELERLDVISGYKAVIDRSKLGMSFKAYILIGLNKHTKKAQDSFEKAILNASEITEIHNITGATEYLIKVETGGIPEYKALHTEVLGSLPQVNSIQTLVILDSIKCNL
ncbi:Lrp/AsnC family transcriptional regulator [Halobacteriovorax sp. GFR7]|uniref:Lrp/AsnC family transcriptional regulator n=1 Tax=unclassified Halobacteriovorax TaxID=2639665 RepID=UPI003D9893BF